MLGDEAVAFLHKHKILQKLMLDRKTFIEKGRAAQKHKVEQIVENWHFDILKLATRNKPTKRPSSQSKLKSNIAKLKH